MAFRTEFADLAGWTNGGGVSINPAGWAYHPGNNTAGGFIYRTMAADESYCETKTYLDVNSADWMMMKINSNTGPMYDNAAANGCGLAIRGSGAGFAFLGGTITGWNGAYTVSPRPGDATTARTIGIERISASIYDFFLDGQFLGRQTTTVATTGTLFVLGGYNGVGAHFDHFFAGKRDIFVVGGSPSPMVLG